jgi:hypothetical protein
MKTAAAHLGVYLNDHLAGATAALKMLDTLAAHDDVELRDFAATLRQAISQDRDQLARLMENASIEIGTARRAVGWITEMGAELKLTVDDPTDGRLKTFELLEMLALGIDGKRALWAALRIVSTEVPSLRADYSTLAHRADEQRTAVESRRLECAAKAFSGTTS